MRNAALLFVVLTAAAAQTRTLQPWTPGTLDIHQISTGRGNAALLVLPDGQTLLVDAGGAGDGIAETEPHLAGAPSPGAAVGRYVRRHAAKLDYVLLTHFHSDHIDGLADVFREIPFAKVFDRGWPAYDYPAPQPGALAAYRAFLDSSGVAVERFRPGTVQIVSKVRDFEIRNIIANGEMWTGQAERTRALFPQGENPGENACSAAILVRYGAFRYFTGGDLPGTPDPGFPAWTAPESAIASVVGPVDVQVVSQHGSMGEAADAWLAATQSRVFVIPSWSPSHPAPDTLKRIMNSRYPPAKRYVFPTDLRPSAKTVIGQRASQLAGPPGHIVIRVEPGGSRYSVYVLDNSDAQDRILTVSGHFTSGQHK